MDDDPSQHAMRSTEAEQARFEAIAAAVFERAGGVLHLTEAAELLATTREALYMQVIDGVVLGLMRGDRLVLPRCQFVLNADGSAGLLPGVADVVQMFDRAAAGRLSCLQWLLQPDGNLEEPPLAALRRNRTAAARRAAASFLGLDQRPPG